MSEHLFIIREINIYLLIITWQIGKGNAVCKVIYYTLEVTSTLHAFMETQKVEL